MHDFVWAAFMSLRLTHHARRPRRSGVRFAAQADHQLFSDHVTPAAGAGRGAVRRAWRLSTSLCPEACSAHDRDDPYAVLGIIPGATPEQSRRAYPRLVRQNHPDTNPSHDCAQGAQLRSPDCSGSSLPMRLKPIQASPVRWHFTDSPARAAGNAP